VKALGRNNAAEYMSNEFKKIVPKKAFDESSQHAIIHNIMWWLRNKGDVA